MANNDEQAESAGIWSPPEEEVPLLYQTPSKGVPQLGRHGRDRTHTSLPSNCLIDAL